MPTVPTITPTNADEGNAGRTFTNPGSGPAAQGVTGFKTLTAPNAARINPTNPSIQSGNIQGGQIAGKQLQNFGNVVDTVADHVGDIVLRMQQEANQTMVTSADTALRVAAQRLSTGVIGQTPADNIVGFKQVKGENAIVPVEGEPLTATYLKKFDTERDRIAETLKNDAQRQAFNAKAAAVRGSFEGEALGHMAAEYQNWNKAVFTAAQTQAANDVAINFDQPEARRQAFIRLEESTREVARLDGQPPQTVDLTVAENVSKANTMVVKTALAQGNIPFAQTYYQENYAAFNAQDRLDVGPKIAEQAGNMAAMQYGKAAASGALDNGVIPNGPSAPTGKTPTYANVPAAKPFSEALSAAGGDADDVRYGTHLGFVESSFNMGAKNGSSAGGFQFHPDTFKALMPGGNINSLADQAKAVVKMRRQDVATLGKIPNAVVDDANTYIMHQQGAGGGKALLTAAYNGRQGELAASVLTPAYNGRAGTALDAVAGNIGMRFKTADEKARARDVASNMTVGQFVDYWRTRWSEGTPGRRRASASQPSPPSSALEARTVAMDAATKGGLLPKYIEQAGDVAERDFRLGEQAKTAGETAAFNKAIEWLDANGGNYKGMPSELKHSVSPSQWDSLDTYGARIRKGEDRVTDDATLMTYSNDDKLRTLTQADVIALKPYLSDHDYASVQNQYASLMNAGAAAAKEIGVINTTAMNSAFGSRIATLGWTKKENGDQIAAANTFVRRLILEAQREKGHKLEANEIEDVIDKAFTTEVGIIPHLFGVIPISKKKEYLPLPETTMANVPPEEKEQILDAFRNPTPAQRAKGVKPIQNPTEADILTRWRLNRYRIANR